jgi:hypothetical protein
LALSLWVRNASPKIIIGISSRVHTYDLN